MEAQKVITGGLLDFHLGNRPHLRLRVDEGVNDDCSLVANQPLRQTNAGSSMLEEINVYFVAEEIVHLPGH
jgi:hypothetical protein